MNEPIVSARDRVRAIYWIATALLGTQGLAAGGLVTLQTTPYLGQPVFWLGAVLGGLLFGHGMVLAGGSQQTAAGTWTGVWRRN